MPLYHIHLCGASDGANDQDGEEFADDAAARDHLVACIRAIAADGLSATADCSAFVFELRDQEGQLVATVPFTQEPELTDGWREWASYPAAHRYSQAPQPTAC